MKTLTRDKTPHPAPAIHNNFHHGAHVNHGTQQMSNSSSISHFLLLALADTRQLQLLHFCLFLSISLVALLGNGLVISAIACDHHLHSPMFFFLLNLALSDLGSICTTVPKAMHNSLWDTRTISYAGCAARVFFCVFCAIRILACAHMAAAAWASAFLNALLLTANTFSLSLCQGKALGQFFCEVPHILKLSCSNSYFKEFGLILFSLCLGLCCFVFIVFSYQGRHKAFSTCLPHLAVASLLLSTVMFAHLKSSFISSPSLDLSLSVLYSVIPPALNPLIYNLGNQGFKSALGKLFKYILLEIIKGCEQMQGSPLTPG
uniref:G-protein coupled receptors family 1 profile domain-containing protein n=1 Tax=Zosterops lateralis melanops TaxID=1220523 RepID=A0A8D2PXK8_ZOSLA